MKNIITISVLILIVLTGSKTTDEKRQMALKSIIDLVDREKGFEDIGLQITEKRILKDRIIFTGKGLFECDTVGMKFETLREYNPGVLENGGFETKSGYTLESVKIYSIGLQSDNFVKALAKIYKLKCENRFSKKPLVASAFSLSTTHIDLTKSRGYFKSKLFLEENSEDSYCEIFFNINLDKGIIELPEKDLDYRENLIKVFTR